MTPTRKNENREKLTRMETTPRTPLEEDITTPVTKSPNGYAVTLWFLFLSVLASIPAYYRMFTGFSYWDD